MDGQIGGRDLAEATGVALDYGVHCDVCHRVEAVDLGGAPGVAGRLKLLDATCPAVYASLQAGAGLAMKAIEPAYAAAVFASPGVLAVTLGPNIGPLGGYGLMTDWAKIAMAVQMILGRLELLTLLAVLMPSFWRR